MSRIVRVIVTATGPVLMRVPRNMIMVVIKFVARLVTVLMLMLMLVPMIMLVPMLMLVPMIMLVPMRMLVEMWVPMCYPPIRRGFVQQRRVDLLRWHSVNPGWSRPSTSTVLAH
jgi:hypothetical protein